jgi:hypothetical protein
MPKPPKKELLSAAEAADIAGVSHAQITRLCANGTVAHVRVGNRLIIRADSLRESMGARRKVGRPGDPMAKHRATLVALRKAGHGPLAACVQKVLEGDL